MKTVQQQETEAILSMARTIENLTQQVKQLQERVDAYERKQYIPSMPAPMYPYMPQAPLNPSPWTTPWPSYPPYTITCKMADGTTKEIATGPIFATTNNG